jgi:ATP-binding cassette subfamily B protein
MNVWRLIWRLARYRFHLYLASGLFASTMFYLFPLIPGLLVRWFFDTLTGARPAGLNEWSLIALLLVGYLVFRFLNPSGGTTTAGNSTSVAATTAAGGGGLRPS